MPAPISDAMSEIKNSIFHSNLSDRKYDKVVTVLVGKIRRKNTMDFSINETVFKHSKCSKTDVK